LKGHRGFTLIEVALAVAVLGVALTTLIAMQSGYIRSYQHERNLVRAALIGQFLLSVWEADDDIPAPGRSDRPLLPVLRRLGYFAENDRVQSMEQDYADWILVRNVSRVGIPPVEDVLRRIQLELSWGQGPGDRFSLVYFMKSQELPVTDDDADSESPGD
jgi:prepilin-type N-terminal cleavage/methylation domain-containing protein